MPPTDYRAAIAALNLSQIGAAKLFQVNPRTSRSWALGERPIPEAVAIALRLMIDEHRRNKAQ